MFSDVLPTFSEVRVLFQTADNAMLWPRVLVKGSQPRVFKNVLTTETPCVRDGCAPACGKSNKSTSVYDCPQCQQNKNRTVVSDQQLQRKPTGSSRQKIEDCTEDTRMRSASISALLPLPPFTCTRKKKRHMRSVCSAPLVEGPLESEMQEVPNSILLCEKEKRNIGSLQKPAGKTLDATCEVGSDVERMSQVVSTYTSACIFARLHLDLVPRHRTQRSPLPQPCSLLSISVLLKVCPWLLQLFKEECVRARHLLLGVASCVGLLPVAITPR